MPDRVQRILGVLGACLSLPLVGLLGLAIRLESPGPAIHAGARLGVGGRPFRCFKLRTMRVVGGSGGPAITGRDDARITPLGALLRRLRLDELPQLWNVARGEMRLVGPRPEAPAFVDLDDPLQRAVLGVAPGITGLAQLFFADEARELDDQDPEASYRARILPRKLRVDAAYVRHRSLELDLWILAQTPRALLGRRPIPPAAVRQDLDAALAAPFGATREPSLAEAPGA